MRFLENHDEPRIASKVPRAVEQAEAVAIATLPGATLWHEGQFEGRTVRPPVFLARRPVEVPDQALAAWYRRMIAAVGADRVRTGDWRLLEVTGWADNASCEALLAWSWAGADGVPPHLVVVNLSAGAAQGRVAVPWPDLGGRRVHLRDALSGAEFDREGDELAGPGLYVALEAWQHHVLSAT